MKIEDKLSLLGIVENLALKEAGLIWQRFSMMLYACTALFGILTFSYQFRLFHFVIGTSVLGPIICTRVFEKKFFDKIDLWHINCF